MNGDQGRFLYDFLNARHSQEHIQVIVHISDHRHVWLVGQPPLQRFPPSRSHTARNIWFMVLFVVLDDSCE